MEYSEKLKDPRWQKLRLQVFERDEWMCQHCGDVDSTLSVHHLRYIPSKEPWDYSINLLLTLCESCHSQEYKDMPAALNSLCEQIRDIRFFSHEIDDITAGFSGLVRPGHPATSTVIKFFLSDHEAFQQVWDLYFARLAEGRNEVV